MSWNNFNTAEDEEQFALIPHGTIAKVQMQIKMNGYNDPKLGWMGGYVTKSKSSNALYLNCKYTILKGEYVNKVLWDNIGLYSDKDSINKQEGKITYEEMGKQRIKSILNSIHSLKMKDLSNEAQEKRKILNFPAMLDNSIFAIEIGIELDQNDTLKNKVKKIITADHAMYNKIMGIEISSTNTKLDVEFTDDEIPF